jgi:hypothetical protein
MALDHAGMIVIGVMGKRLDRDEVAGVDRDHRRQRAAEIAQCTVAGLAGTT